MVPKWLRKLLAYVVLILLAIAAFFVVSGYFTSLRTGQVAPYSNVPTLDATKIAEFTPSYQPNDVVNMVATAMPTPRVFLTEPELDSMNSALAGKQRFFTSNALTGAEFQKLGVSWYCSPAGSLLFQNLGTDIGAAKVVEEKWTMQVNLSDITFTVEKGSLSSPVNGQDAAGPTIETKYNGILVIDIKKFGIDGPTVLRGNDYYFAVGNPLTATLTELYYLPRALFLNDNLMEKARQNDINMADALVKLETIVPDASDVNLRQMYATFKTSFSEPSPANTAPNETHIYDTFVTIFDAVAKQYGFAGIEGVRLIMPPVPATIYDWPAMTNSMLIPREFPGYYANSTCPHQKPTQADIQKLLDEAAKNTP